MVLLHIGLFSGHPSGVANWPLARRFVTPPVVREERQVDVHERVGRGEALPRGRDTAKTIDDPSVSVEEVGVDLQVLLVGNLASARSELDRSSGYSGSPVISARRLASVDFPPPALPNTATFLTRSFEDLVGAQ